MSYNATNSVGLQL